MNDVFKILETQPKETQFDFLLELLQEKAVALHRAYNVYRFSTQLIPLEEVEVERIDCERIKNKLKQMYNENIQTNEFHVQNIAQP